jgi:signal transduction histidine kinase
VVERHAAEARSHRLSADAPAGLPPVVADASALRRVLCGLVENAIKYTPDGGRITISAREDVDSVALCVADTGRGIRAEDIPHVFEKFYRGRPAVTQDEGGRVDDGAACPEAPGVGLGLYLAKTIVTQMGGRLGVESVAGHGSIFTVHLPVWHEEGVTDEEEEERHVEATARG